MRADAGDARIAARRLLDHRAIVHRPHGAEFENGKRFLVEAVALLPEYHRPRPFEPDEQSDRGEQRRERQQRERGHGDVEHPFFDLLQDAEGTARHRQAADRPDARDLGPLQMAQRTAEAQMHRKRQFRQRRQAGLDEIAARPRQRDKHIVGAVQSDRRHRQSEILVEEGLGLPQSEAADQFRAVGADAFDSVQLVNLVFEPDHGDPPPHSQPVGVRSRQSARDPAPRQDETGEPQDIEQGQAAARIVADGASGDAQRQRPQRREIPQRKGAHELARLFRVICERVSAIVQLRQNDQHRDDQPDVDAGLQALERAAKHRHSQQGGQQRRRDDGGGVGERGGVSKA